jgi:hypothetical protein
VNPSDHFIPKANAISNIPATLRSTHAMCNWSLWQQACASGAISLLSRQMNADRSVRDAACQFEMRDVSRASARK